MGYTVHGVAKSQTWLSNFTYLLTYLQASAFIVNPLKWSLCYLFYTHGPPESIQLYYKDSHVPIAQWSKPKQHSPRVNSVALGLPWWLSGKESTCQHRRCGFDPWSWKIHPWINEAHVPHLLTLCSGAQELQLLSPCVAITKARMPQSPCSTMREAIARRSPYTAAKRSPHSLQLEKNPYKEDPAQPISK